MKTLSYTSEELASAFKELVDIIARLRDPNGGCPWDLEQTHESLKPYVIEEAFEVVEAIDNGPEALSGELGDLLLQTLLHSQIASQNGTFNIITVLKKISHKLITRHPHVFGDVSVKGSKEVLQNWEQIKQKELKENQSILDGVPKGMPALLRAQRIGEKAARVGFEWPTIEGVRDKVLEEVSEFAEAALDPTKSKDAIEEEFGDILFALTQFARRLELNSEDLLHQATGKFISRFKKMEIMASKPLKEMDIDELDTLWEKVKAENSY